MKKMMTKAPITAAILGLSVMTISASAFAASTSCEDIFTKSSRAWQLSAATDEGALEASWRANTTNVIEGQSLAPTSALREQWLQKASAAMLKFLYSQTDTPEMVFAAAEGVTVTVPAEAISNPSHNTIPLNYTTDASKQGFHYEEVPRIFVTGLGPSGILRGTILLPVSGHTGIPNAEKWAKTDTYELYVENDKNVKTAQVATKAPSLDMITAQEVVMKLEPGKVTQLLYWRSGSGGPGGYDDGRTYEIVWDGK